MLIGAPITMYTIWNGKLMEHESSFVSLRRHENNFQDSLLNVNAS